MKVKTLNKSLNRAAKVKEDEFYTQITDIERELSHYTDYFCNKTVFCNCDDPRISNFFKYFALNFNKLKLNRLISTCYRNQEIDLFSQNHSDKAIYLDYTGNPSDPTSTDFSTIEVNNLIGDGDFRSFECIELLKESDIVVTNPPFSLFREYIAQLVNYNKKFIILGSQNNITYKETFRLFQENKVWMGYKAGDMSFKVPDYYTVRDTRFWIDETGQKWRSLGNICWYTNFDTKKRHDKIILYKKYSPEEYPKYDTYNAINVNKVLDIPMDFDGLMGVPITFLDKYNPDQFEIIGLDRYLEDNPNYGRRFTINEKETYARIIIRNKLLEK